MAGNKGVRTGSNFQPQKCAKGYTGDDDRISKCPDDILVTILSLLPFKEAARTSVLSSRWINVWKHITSSLDFDGTSAFGEVSRRINSIEESADAENMAQQFRTEERLKYVKWVNSVLESHKAVTLKEFRICFDLNIEAQDTVTKWLEYAVSKHVERLELDLKPAHGIWLGFPALNYDFRYPLTPLDFKPLKALSLKFVNIIDEAIHFFLRNCPLLEELIVHETNGISNLEVCGSSLKLKRLEVCYCNNLNSIKVSAPNLSSLKVTMFDKLLLENVPMLVEVSGACSYLLGTAMAALSGCVSQLESLNLLLGLNVEICEIPQMPQLKKLLIESWSIDDESLLGLTSLIESFPYLSEFVLKLLWDGPSRSGREIGSKKGFPLQRLKVVKVCGYYGRSSDLELVRYFVENCIALEKLIIDPSFQPYAGQCHGLICPDELLDMERNARDYAKEQLQAHVPPHIELTIL